MRSVLKQQLLEVLQGVVPLIAISTIYQIVMSPAPASVFVRFVVGSTLAIIGLVLLYAGVERGILPMGEYIGAELPRLRSVLPAVGVAFAFGFATTVAEPDVLVLGNEVAAMPDSPFSAPVLVAIVGGGVGIFTAIALLRVVFGTSMVKLLAAVYGPMVLLTFFARSDFVPLAYDAGSVTTGVLTAPVVLALARGFAAVLGDRDVVTDGFGFLGLASAGPIVVLLVLGVLS